MSSMSFMSSPPWPDPPAPEAFHGLAGDFVRRLDPHTESDPVALLFQTLIAFGNVIGDSAHFTVEGDRHGAKLFAVLNGRTSKARKGTSWGNVRSVFGVVNPQWMTDCIQSGLSSGEGLIYAVRDAYGNDPGVADKRLLIHEPEFASVLKVAAREGNTLSTTIREAWDTGTLRVLSRQSPLKATGAHVSIIGHITQEELRQHLTSTDMANGFANRFFWPCVKRSKLLPEGGNLPAEELEELTVRLQDACAFAQTAGEIKRDEEARELWISVYPDLSEGRPGLVGAITSRAEAQVMRLAMIYALLDSSPLIKKVHLEAALALWRYSEASVEYIWGDSLGDPAADTLLRQLRQQPDGMTRTEIRDFFHRNKKSSETDRVLELLLSLNLITCETETTTGRPVTRFIANRYVSVSSVPISRN
jgi:Protein of unknown function (DUF3987)